MGVKADLKAVRAHMQAGKPAEALCMISKILDSGAPDLQDAQTMYAVLVTAGLAGLASGDFQAAERSFRRATESQPDAPQAWKGLIDCLERAGDLAALPECLRRAAEIAEGKGNYSRALPLRLRLGEVLHGLGRPDEALDALLRHLNVPAATAAAADAGDEGTVPRLFILLLAALLEVSKEDSAISRRVEKRVAKDGGIAVKSHDAGSHSVLAHQYRAKAILKDDEEGGPVARRMQEAMAALREARPALTEDVLPGLGGRHRLLAQFCRARLKRAVQRAEAKGGGEAVWREVVIDCDAFSAVVGDGVWGEKWPATARLLSSWYHPCDTSGLRQVAEQGKDDQAHPWFAAECCLLSSSMALSAGDGLKANELLKAAAIARERSPAKSGDTWVGFSGPGKDWRELTLRSLIADSLGYPGVDRDPDSALSRLDAATASYQDSRLLRGDPVGHLHIFGSLGLARASLLIGLGRLEDARAAVKDASGGVAHFASDEGIEDASPAERAGPVLPCLHYRALCVESDVDFAEGNAEEAQAKLRDVLRSDDGFVDALSRLGRLLLGLAGDVVKATRKEDADAARPFLEKAAAEQPGSSFHAFQLARCYWEAGGHYRNDRSLCFSVLLKAAKLDPSNAEAFEWLGHWYQGVGGDRERARGCYQRAIKLDPEMRGAGEALAKLHLENGQDTLAVSLFHQCASLSVACHWAWAGLGRSKIVEGKLAEAAGHIQQAIRGCPTSWSYWSDLGWCYHAEGKQAAALKAYTRAKELLTFAGRADSVDTYPTTEMSEMELTALVRMMTQIGTIQRTIGQVDEAVDSFSEALALKPDARLALVGAGEAYLSQAHARTSEGLYTAAATALRKGCKVTRACLDDGSTVPYVRKTTFKLLGDLYTYGHRLPPVSFEADGGAAASDTHELASAEKAQSHMATAKAGAQKRLDFVAQGASAYQRLVTLLRAEEATNSSNELSPALYDLGLNHLLRARLVCTDAGEGSGLWEQETYENISDFEDLVRAAAAAFKQAIEADPLYSDAWNGLGAVCADALLQQHCWVRAVQLAHNPSAWANLGMLYLRWGLDVQAYESFGGLQAVTDHPVMWVGLGLLKEKEACQPGITPAKRKRLLSQASDAYYSSLETGQHVDGLLGLGTTAGRTHNQADAIVALQQHLDLNPGNSQAWNHLGAAAELVGRGALAVAAYRVAAELLEEQILHFRRKNVPTTMWDECLRLTRGNLGRALVAQERPKEALEWLDYGEETEAENLLQTARAHTLLGNWDASLAAFEKLTTLGATAGGEMDKGGQISRAAMLYRKGERAGTREAAAKLMEDLSSNERALQTALSLGSCAGHPEVTRLAIQLLQKTQKRPQRTCPRDPSGQSDRHLAVEALIATHLAMRASDAKETSCRRALSKAVHLSPSDVHAWSRLGAAVADSAACVTRPRATLGDPLQADCASGDLARACYAAARELAMFSVLGKGRDVRGGNAGGEVNAEGATAAVTAAELSCTLVGLAKAAMCSGRPGRTTEAVKASIRALHLCPGESKAWRCLGASLAGRALALAPDSDEAQQTLYNAHTAYRAIWTSAGADTATSNGKSPLGAMEAAFVSRLVSAGDPSSQGWVDESREASSAEGTAEGSREINFARVLASARRALLQGDRQEAVSLYKTAIRGCPQAATGWLELSAFYELCGLAEASMATLECGVRAAGHGAKGKACSAAALRLQLASIQLVAGREEESLASLGGAFRVGKGGAAGHMLRGIANLRLGKTSQAQVAFDKAREADPAVAQFTDRVAARQAYS